MPPPSRFRNGSRNLFRKRALQTAVAVAALVPLTAGLVGIFAPARLDLAGSPQSLTHTAYLSGLLLAIGLGFWSTVPAIETKGARFSLLTALVALGGLARLIAAIRLGVWSPGVTGPLVMELGVTPALWLWQKRLAR
jgi:hypothetical protein